MCRSVSQCVAVCRRVLQYVYTITHTQSLSLPVSQYPLTKSFISKDYKSWQIMLFPAPICFALQHTATHTAILCWWILRDRERDKVFRPVCVNALCVCHIMQTLSVTKCFAVCCSVSHTKSARYHTHNSELTHKVCCSVLQCVAACCSVLQFFTQSLLDITHTTAS